MIKYQYQIVRYIHDQFTGEFGNIGLIVYAPQRNYFACKMVGRYARLSNFFGEINGVFLLNSIRHLETEVKKISENLEDFIKTHKLKNDLHCITETILPKDDSALQLSEILFGLDLDPEIALQDLFERLVEKYNPDEKAQPHTDAYAWKNVYKIYFDKYNITKQLKKYSVSTEKDTIDFEKAWKNGVWNCYQPLSLDLKSVDSIKSKVYKWSGILKALQTAREELHVVFLTTSPQDHEDLQSFIDETLTLKEGNLIVEVVEENDAEKFVANVRNAMEASNKMSGEDDGPF